MNKDAIQTKFRAHMICFQVCHLYLWVRVVKSLNQSLSSMLMVSFCWNLIYLPFYPCEWSFSPDTLDIPSSKSQIGEIPCFGKSIDFQQDLFQQSFAGVGNSIFWQFHWVFHEICFNRCGKFLVLANPLTFNRICFNKAISMGDNFISSFLRVSLFFCRLNYFVDNFSGYLLLEGLVVLKGQ